MIPILHVNNQIKFWPFSFVFVSDYFAQIDECLLLTSLLLFQVIDACAKGNLGRFINHSCDPNCRTEKVNEIMSIIFIEVIRFFYCCMVWMSLSYLQKL